MPILKVKPNKADDILNAGGILAKMEQSCELCPFVPFLKQKPDSRIMHFTTAK